jgi:hypothetical protein
MDVCSYKEDLEYSKNPAFRRCFDNFYTSELFREKYLKHMYRKNIPIVVKLIRTEELLVQKGVGIDVLIVLSNKTSLLVDEKVDRPVYIHSPNIFLELMSNPQMKTEGWAYHKGRYICYSCSNEDKSGLCKEPVFFFIDDAFINTFNRNKKYPVVHCSKITDGLYRSLGKKIPRDDIISFMQGKLKTPEKKMVNGTLF